MIVQQEARAIPPMYDYQVGLSYNHLEPDDPYVYRPVGFRGIIDFSDLANIWINGYFAFDGWIYGEYGTLFVEVGLGDQIVSNIPIELIEVKSEEWSQTEYDAVWICYLDLYINGYNSPLFNLENSQGVNLSIQLQAREDIFEYYIRIIYGKTVFFDFISDIHNYIFNTKINFNNTHNISSDKDIILSNKYIVDAVYKTNTLTELYNKTHVAGLPIKIVFDDIENDRFVDYIFKIVSNQKINVIIKELEYEIVKYQLNQPISYQYKSYNEYDNVFHNQEVIIENKLTYEYSATDSKFVTRNSDFGTFVLENNDKLILKGKLVVNINGINQYIFFEKIAYPIDYQNEFEILHLQEK